VVTKVDPIVEAHEKRVGIPVENIRKFPNTRQASNLSLAIFQLSQFFKPTSAVVGGEEKNKTYVNTKYMSCLWKEGIRNKEMKRISIQPTGNAA
jgi:hypothetical protein